MSVWMLPGQGAQKPGMGADLLQVPQAFETFAIASEELGVDLVRLAIEGSEEEINQAYNAQALTMVVSVGLGKALKANGIMPDAMLGFSLGQISALVLSEMLTEREAFKLLKVRAGSMAKSCEEQPGGMLALLAASHEEAFALCEECAQGDILLPANFNCPGQVVVSGTVAAIDRAQERWKELGKRGSRLNTAGGFHTPLMDQASVAVAQVCSEMSFADPIIPALCNTDALPMTAADAADRLERQVKSPVKFQQSVEALIEQGATSFLEVGFGGVLCNLVKRIDRSSVRAKVGTYEELQQLLAAEGE